MKRLRETELQRLSDYHTNCADTQWESGIERGWRWIERALFLELQVAPQRHLRLINFIPTDSRQNVQLYFDCYNVFQLPSRTKEPNLNLNTCPCQISLQLPCSSKSKCVSCSNFSCCCCCAWSLSSLSLHNLSSLVFCFSLSLSLSLVLFLFLYLVDTFVSWSRFNSFEFCWPAPARDHRVCLSYEAAADL